MRRFSEAPSLSAQVIQVIKRVTIFNQLDNLTSDIHEKHEQPSQYRASCENCGNESTDYLRMHSYLREKHIATINGVQWNVDVDQI